MNVVFDLGNVLIPWDPRAAVRSHLSPEDVELFFREACTEAWNWSLDRGRTFDEAIADIDTRLPQWSRAIRLYRDHWLTTLGPPIETNLRLLRRLQHLSVPVYALTNWSAETFPLALNSGRYDFLRDFDGVVVSGEVGLAKPEEAIYRLLLERYGLTASKCLFIDDRLENCEAARRVGLRAVQYLGQDLRPAVGEFLHVEI